MIRERRVRRELREELAARTSGQWGWASRFVRSTGVRGPKRLATGEELAMLLSVDSGSADGGG